MRRFIQLFLVFSFTISSAITFADKSQSSKEAENQKWKITANYDSISKSKFKRSSGHQGEKIAFKEADIALSYSHQFDDNNSMFVSVGYTPTCIDWNENPEFDKEHFRYINIGIGATSFQLDHWMLHTAIKASMDTEKMGLNRYSYYEWLFHTRYCFSDKVGLHIGFIAKIGLRKDAPCPILGFDWKINNKWKLNFVIPVNMSLIYKVNQKWFTALAYRPFTTRHRLGKNETRSHGIYEYRNSGAEISLNYKHTAQALANIHFGSTFGGLLKVADDHNHHASYYRFKNSFYWGVEALLRF